ncbi:penicillin-binding protein 2 [bacterium]|nr:penicillin-binding protein 2 [bacterium]
MAFHFLNKKRVKNKWGETDLEEFFLDNFLKKEKKGDEILSRKIEIPLNKTNFISVLVLALVAVGFLWSYSFILQVGRGDLYTAMAQRNKFITLDIGSERGVIYDKNMQQLVSNQVVFQLWLDKSKLPEDSEKRDKLISKAASVIGEDKSFLDGQIKESRENFFPLKENLSHQDLVLFKARETELRGFEIRKIMVRDYLNKACLSHILGYLGEISSDELKSLSGYKIGDYLGRSGLEKSYENVLKEKKGEIQVERNAKGKEISRKVLKYPASGYSLVLNLDLPFQEKIAESLSKSLDENNVRAGAVVAIDPQNGGILASVSKPCFDNNLFSKGISKEELDKINSDKSKPQLNRTVSGLYPTGSTIKPLIGLAALEEGIITQATKIYCPLELCVENKYTKEKECFPDWRFHGLTDIKKAIAQSVNPFFYMIGGGYIRPNFADKRLPSRFNGLGVDKIKEYLSLFNFGKVTGIDLPGESKGRVPDPSWKKSYFKKPVLQKWYLADTYNLSIGQGYFLATPLQVAVAFSAIANGGTLYKPEVVAKIIDSNRKLIKEIKPVVIRENFVSKKNIEVIKQGMEEAVSSPDGSAFSLSSLPVCVAAKTGTAQIATGADVYDNWIAAFAPCKNPQIVLVVVVENVKHTRIVAQKIAKEVLEWYFSNGLNKPGNKSE